VCIPGVIGALPVWWHNNNKKKSAMTARAASGGALLDRFHLIIPGIGMEEVLDRFYLINSRNRNLFTRKKSFGIDASI